MTIDLSQFKQLFLEESTEGLEVLESGLLALDFGTADDIEPEMDRVNKVQAQFNAVLSGNETAAEELLDLSYDAN